jgi:hypothetical protein
MAKTHHDEPIHIKGLAAHLHVAAVHCVSVLIIVCLRASHEAGGDVSVVAGLRI